jgi:hypothetical protein
MNDREMILRVPIIVNHVYHQTEIADTQDECSWNCKCLMKYSSKTCLCTLFGILEMSPTGMPKRNVTCVRNSTDL